MYEFFQSILVGINSMVNQWGWSVMLFTLLIRLLILPFDYKSRVGMRKTQKIQPELTRLQKKYANDREKLNLKMNELYKQNGVNPLSSCLPMLLSMPILFCMFGAMRLVANEQILIQARELLLGHEVQFEGWFWIKNVMMPDSPFASMLPSLSMLQQVTDVNTWTKIFTPEVMDAVNAQVASLGDQGTLVLTADSFLKGNLQSTASALYAQLKVLPAYVDSGAMPNWTTTIPLLGTFSIMKDWNGLFILPVLSAASQYLMTKLNPTQPKETDAQGNEIKNPNQPSGMGFMTWFFPLFSLWICSSYNGMFALYWVASNIFAMVETVGINKYLDAKEAKEKKSVEEVTGSVK